MKYIFDFDDVLFKNTKKFKKNMFKVIAEAGVPEKEARVYYLKVREKEFSLKSFLIKLLGNKKANKTMIKEIYKQIMIPSKRFLNKEIIKIAEKVGKKNCYIVTNGDRDFQLDKIRYSGITKFFLKSNIYIVARSKKNAVLRICRKNFNDEIVFMDDKIIFIEDIASKKIKNLKVIHYTN
jgi:hypothetical protein